jgi:Sortase domain
MDAPATTSAPRRRSIVVAAVSAAVLVAAAVAAYVLSRPAPHHEIEAAPRVIAAAPSTPAPRPKPVPTPAKPTAPHDAVAAAAPTAFTLTGPRFTIKAHVCPMADIRPYDPPGEQEHTVCWVRSGFGVKPGSDAATSYVFGHSWAEDPLEVLNKASAPATREILRTKPVTVDGVAVYPVHVLDGYRLVLKTHAGTLTYRVRNVYGVRKRQLGFIKSWFDEKQRNRIVLTTCAERRGVDYDYNIVVEAYLYSSVAA